MAKLIPKPGRTAGEQAYLPAIAKGLGVTMRHFFKNTFGMAVGNQEWTDVVTVQYPEDRWEPERLYPERFRGVHRLTQRTDGSPRCVACLCCSTACPAQCIFIEPGEYPVGDPRRGYERFPVKFVIDELRCVFCGYCVEACPCDAIRMDTGAHVPASTKRSDFLYDRETLLSIPGADGTFLTRNPRHEPGDETHPGLSREHGH